MRIRAYQKGELAQMYYPWCSRRHAVRCLNRDIEHAWTLRRLLQQTGWRPDNRILTPQQVTLIFNKLGEP